MSITELFIRRPVMTTLVMLGILLFGVMGYRLLPVSDLPNVDFPTILVSARPPGATPAAHGARRGDSAGETILHHRGHRQHDVHECAGADSDHHPIHFG